LSDFDFARDVEALLSLVHDEESYSFAFVRSSSASSLSFFKLFRSVNSTTSFQLELSRLQSHFQHVILCFCSGQMRWTFLSRPSSRCPLCDASSWSWEHFFLCPRMSLILQSRGLLLSRFRERVISARWKRIFSDIAHFLLVWSFALNDDPAFTLSYDVDVFHCLCESRFRPSQ
jgi:hypothetical protein